MDSFLNLFRTARTAPEPDTNAGPAAPNAHRNSSLDRRFPFPQPGRWKKRALPPHAEALWPFVDMDALDDKRVAPRAVRSPISAEAFKKQVAEFADDVGIISVDDPAIAHELHEIR